MIAKTAAMNFIAQIMADVVLNNFSALSLIIVFRQRGNVMVNSTVAINPMKIQHIVQKRLHARGIRHPVMELWNVDR